LTGASDGAAYLASGRLGERSAMTPE
jgi:hypothetical protein